MNKHLPKITRHNRLIKNAPPCCTNTVYTIEVDGVLVAVRKSGGYVTDLTKRDVNNWISKQIECVDCRIMV